jgi:hypothetical protein
MLSVLLTSCVVWLKFLEMRRFSSADLWSTKVSLLPLSFWVKRKRGQRTHRIPHTHEQTCVCGVAVGESSSPCGGFLLVFAFSLWFPHTLRNRTAFRLAFQKNTRVSSCVCVCLFVFVCMNGTIFLKGEFFV